MLVFLMFVLSISLALFVLSQSLALLFFCCLLCCMLCQNIADNTCSYQQSETGWLRGFFVDDYDLRVVGGSRESPPAPVFLIRLSIASGQSAVGTVHAAHGRSEHAPCGSSWEATPEKISSGLAEVLVTVSLDTGDVRGTPSSATATATTNTTKVTHPHSLVLCSRSFPL